MERRKERKTKKVRGEGRGGEEREKEREESSRGTKRAMEANSWLIGDTGGKEVNKINHQQPTMTNNDQQNNKKPGKRCTNSSSCEKAPKTCSAIFLMDLEK